jgi:hypothetical protein
MCTNLWHTLSDTEKATWESIARPFHMTGYAYYQSQCLRPNPGIYLPLAGGTMSGNIDMATKKILNLPAPVANEEPARKTDLTSAITTHSALTSGAHGAGLYHLALFRAASTLVNKIIWKDASQQALNDANRTVSLNWTDLALTAYTSATATFALVLLRIIINSISGGWGNILIRKNGTTPSEPYITFIGAAMGDQAGAQNQMVALVGLDAGQVIEYKIDLGVTINVTSLINVIGYVE